MISIQQLSLDLSIGIDTLRIWERRYGFPVPERDSRGHRCYPPQQVEELRMVKKLQNLGYRPSKIFSLTATQRRELLKKLLGEDLPDNSAHKKLTTELPPKQIDLELNKHLQTLGLSNFIHQYAVPMIQTLDRGWTEGTLSIAREHLVSDRLEQLLKQQLATAPRTERKTQLLFLTLSGERHKLGLLMSAVLFHAAGFGCILLQEELPLSEIPQLATDLQVAGVALSFSAHYATKQAKQDLARLRSCLHQDIKLIAGGHAVEQGVRLPNVVICSDLQKIPELGNRLFPNKP